MANLQMRVRMTVEFEETNGNSKKKGVIIPKIFRTVDSDGRYRFFNRGRAFEQLLNFLYDYEIGDPGKGFDISGLYDREKRILSGKYKKTYIQEE